MRGLGLVLALLCTTVAAGFAAGADALRADPSAMFWRIGLPLLVALAAFALALLPGSVRKALSSSLVTLALLELVAFLLNARGQPHVETQVDPDYYQDDAVLGYAPRPGIATRAWKRVDDATVYDVHYAIDNRGRRVTPVQDADRSRFLLFFGGSFMFGEGVDPHETLPARVAERAPDYAPYNYAFHGYGPTQLLARLESSSLRAEIPQERGSAVYLFIDAHVNRAIGSLVVHTGWAHATPYYALNGGEHPVRRGTLTSARPATALLYSVLGQSQLVKFFGVDLPAPIADRHIELTASILARSAQLLRADVGLERFVVVSFPGSRHAARLGPALDALGVEHLDYSSLFDWNQPEYFIAEDWHPSPRAHHALAEQLVADLELVRSAADHR